MMGLCHVSCKSTSTGIGGPISTWALWQLTAAEAPCDSYRGTLSEEKSEEACGWCCRAMLLWTVA